MATLEQPDAIRNKVWQGRRLINLRNLVLSQKSCVLGVKNLAPETRHLTEKQRTGSCFKTLCSSYFTPDWESHGQALNYFPDVAHCVIWVFGKLKTTLQMYLFEALGQAPLCIWTDAESHRGEVLKDLKRENPKLLYFLTCGLI